MNIESLVPMVLDQPNQPLVHSLVQDSQALRNQSKEFPEAFPYEGTSEIICFYETETSPTAAKVCFFPKDFTSSEDVLSELGS